MVTHVLFSKGLMEANKVNTQLYTENQKRTILESSLHNFAKILKYSSELQEDHADTIHW